MLLYQDPITCEGKYCFEAELSHAPAKLSGQLETLWGNSYSVMYSRKLQGHESSKYILFTAQTILFKEARLACALLLALGWHKEFSFLSKRFRGKGALLKIHLLSHKSWFYYRNLYCYEIKRRERCAQSLWDPKNRFV